MINSLKRTNLDLVKKQTKEAEEVIAKKRRITEETVEKLTSLQLRMAEEVNKAEHVVKLNVGGQMFSTSKATLLSKPDTYFTAMLGSGQWKPQTADGSYFIDRNPKYFEIILEYLRTNKLGTQGLNAEQQQFFDQELSYFQISIHNSLILRQHADKEKILSSWLPDKQKIGPLLFRASLLSTESEFSAKKFHDACDGKAPLLIIAATSDGDICGGYAASSFSSPQKVVATQSKSNFIFTLVNQFNIPPTRFFPKQKSQFAQGSYSKWGPVFGARLHIDGLTKYDPDLALISSRHQTEGISCFPKEYIDTTGKGGALFSRNDLDVDGLTAWFTMSTLEVFMVTSS